MKKRRNKLVTLGMAAMMTAALMSGCGKKATPENLLKDMAKNMKDTESVVANMKMDMEMGDDTTTIGIQMDMDIDMDLKSGESHAKGAVDMKMMGTNVGTEIEMYTVKEKDQYIVYTMANDQWQKEEMDDSAADMAGLLHRKLARQNHPAAAQLRRGNHTLERVNRHLRGRMHRH